VKGLPDFIVVGAAKSGTTSLWKYLSQNPEIYIPEIKECRFFSQMPRDMKGGKAAEFMNSGPRELSEYLALYNGHEDRLCGDISNDYFYFHEKSIKYIKQVYFERGQKLPKIVIILRNPVERVISMYKHIIRLGSDVHSFEEAFALSDSRAKNGYAWMFDLSGVGMSSDGVRHYLHEFPDVRIYLTEDMQDAVFFGDLFQFLGVRPAAVDLSLKHNVSSGSEPASFYLNALMHNVARWKLFDSEWLARLRPYLKQVYSHVLSANQKEGAGIAHGTIQSLEDYYMEDVCELSKLIGRDLGGWVEHAC
jgi:hypothetical protein